MMGNLEMALFRAAAVTFEQLGFVFVTPELQEAHEGADFEAAVGVDFRGPLVGRLVVSLYGDMLPALAANMMGESEPPPVDQQHDALREIANVICGNALPDATGSKEVFYIDAPQTLDGGAPSGTLATAQVSLPLDQGRADVMLFISNAKELRQ